MKLLANKADLRAAILKHLATGGTTNTLGIRRRDKRRPFYDGIRSQLPQQDVELDDSQVVATIWELIRQGLAYMDAMGGEAAWEIFLTDAGLAAASDEEVSPDNSDRYLERLHTLVPEASDTVRQYVGEAVASFNGICYFASVVMLGVASEAAFLEMADSFAKWDGLIDSERQNFSKILNNQRDSCSKKFNEFRKKLNPKRNILGELSDSMDIYFDAIFILIRTYRNDSGHPTGKRTKREDARTILTLFPDYLRRLYDLKILFDSKPAIA